MTLILDLTAEEEQVLRQKAEKRGLRPDEYAHGLITGRLTAEPAGQASPTQAVTPQQWEQSVDTWLKGNQQLPVLSDYAVSRESMYEGREG